MIPRVVAVMSVCVTAVCVLAQDDISEATASEIKRLRKELMQVQEERTTVAEEKDKDAEDFQAYRKTMLRRMRHMRSEIDSLQGVHRDYRSMSDSLSALINAEKSRKKQLELTQDAYRSDLLRACDRALETAGGLPPGVASKTRSALTLLKNELTAGSVDNIEATNRFFRIWRNMDGASTSIQIAQGTSPVPQIRGTAYTLRLGTIFEAVVNAKGTRAAIWEGWTDEGRPEWGLVEDPAVAAEILKAVNVREGKALPELVEVPLRGTPVDVHAESSNEGTDSENYSND